MTTDAVVEEFGTTVVLYPPSSSSSYYRISARDRNGKRIQRSAGRDHMRARAKAADLAEQIDRGVPDATPTVRELIAQYLEAATDLSPRYHAETAYYLERALGPDGDLECWRLSISDIRAALARAETDSMKRHHRAAIGALLSWGHGEGLIPVPRASLMPKQRRTAKSTGGRRHGESHLFIEQAQIPTPDVVRRVAEAMRAIGQDKPGGDIGQRLWLMVAVAASTGVRQGELLELRKKDFKLAERVVQVRRQVVRPRGAAAMVTPPKWGRYRDALLPSHTVWGDDLHGPLGRYLDGLADDDLVFPSPRSQTHWAGQNFNRACWGPARAGVEEWRDGWTWHSLRHTFCSTLLSTGAPVADVALVAGHRDPSVTMSMYVGSVGDVQGRLGASFAPKPE